MMNKKQVGVGIGLSTLLVSGVLLVNTLQKTGEVSQKSQKDLQWERYEEIAQAVKQKAEHEHVIVGGVFKDGYLKKHGDHYHFVYGEVPKDALYEKMPASHPQDAYTFDPKDIVEEQESGYIVKHGDHYHFIPKTNQLIKQDEKGTDIQDDLLFNTQALEERIATIMRLYGLKREQIRVDTKNNAIIYPHGDHYHYEKIGAEHTHEHGHGKQEHTNEHEHTHEHGHGEQEHTNEHEHTHEHGHGKQEHTNEHEHTHEHGHGEQEHANEHEHTHEHGHGKQEDTHKNNDHQHTENEQTETDKQIDNKQALQERINRLMKQYHLKREQIKLDWANNLLIYPHGNHYHYEKIDPNKQQTNEHSHHPHWEPPKIDPTIETEKIIGPFWVERNQLFNKKYFLNTDHTKQTARIKDINNYEVIAFQTQSGENEEIGYLFQDGKKAQAVAYLVLNGTEWDTLKKETQRPIPVPKNNYFFKGWSFDMPNGKVTRSLFFTAQFRHEQHRYTPNVLGPSTTWQTVEGIDKVDLHDYKRIHFSALNNGALLLDGKTSKHFYYYVKSGLTYKEAKESGFVIPEAINRSLYEFIGYTDDLADDKEVDTSIIFAKFGTTRTVIGPYVPHNQENALSEVDRNRPHPNDQRLPYDKDKYISVAFKIVGEGNLAYYGQEGNILTYLVRKGTSWEQLKAYLPDVVVSNGGHEWIDLPDDNEEVQTGTYLVKATGSDKQTLHNPYYTQPNTVKDAIELEERSVDEKTKESRGFGKTQEHSKQDEQSTKKDEESVTNVDENTQTVQLEETPKETNEPLQEKVNTTDIPATE